MAHCCTLHQLAAATAYNALWRPPPSSSRASSLRGNRCTRCAQGHDNGLVSTAAKQFVCRRCYETLPRSERVDFDVSLNRPPAFADYWSLRLSARALYGDDNRVYVIIWALRTACRRLTLDAARAIVEAPIRRIETPSTRSTTFFGELHGFHVSNEFNAQRFQLYWHGKPCALMLVWHRKRFVELYEQSSCDRRAICFFIERGDTNFFDEIAFNRHIIIRRQWFNDEENRYITTRNYER